MLSFDNSTWCQEWDLVNLRTFTKSSQAAVSVKTRKLTKKKSNVNTRKIFPTTSTKILPAWMRASYNNCQWSNKKYSNLPIERFHKATGLDKQSDENQVNTLIYTMSDQADDVHISCELTQEQEKSFEEVKEKFENYFLVNEMSSSSGPNLIHENNKRENQWINSSKTCTTSSDTAISER